jgi:hypothetical protein
MLQRCGGASQFVCAARLRRKMRYRAEQPDQTQISFMKVVELQRRGLPHLHAVIGLDAAPEASRPPSVPDTAVSAHDFAVLVRQATTETTLFMRIVLERSGIRPGRLGR